MATRLLLLWVGLVIGMVAYCGIARLTGSDWNFGRACDRLFFQGTALFAAWLVLRG